MHCDEIENLYENFMKELEEIQYKLYSNFFSTAGEPLFARSLKARILVSLKSLNRFLERFGLQICSTRNRLPPSLNHLSWKHTLSGSLLINQRTLALLRELVSAPSRYVEACESFADETSKKAYVEFLKVIIASSLGITPCMLISMKCINPDAVKLESKGIREIGLGKYGRLYDIQGKFTLENNPDFVKEVFVIENYKDEYHNIVPPPNDLLYIDLGAFMGENIAWASLYAEDSVGYVIEPADFAFKAAKYNLTSPERAGKWLKERNFEVRFVKEYVTAEKGLQKLIDKKDLSKYSNYVIKADIEGAEREVLKASGEFLREYKPVLTLASYHRGDDLIVLPELIMKANDSYKLYLRPSFLIDQLILFAK